MAAAAGKAIYCEKPTATESAEALRLAELVEGAGLKNGVVQDKLWLPELPQGQDAPKELGFFGEILSVRGEFGYWVFTGLDYDQPAQRPSWNYRAEDGGGIMIDMFCHWQLRDRQPVRPDQDGSSPTATPTSTSAGPRTASPTAAPRTTRPTRSSSSRTERCASSTPVLGAVRVRRDDLLDRRDQRHQGQRGSRPARRLHVQSAAETPSRSGTRTSPSPSTSTPAGRRSPDNIEYDNAFKIQWEEFLRHVALDEPWRYTLREGAKGVQLAELGMQELA